MTLLYNYHTYHLRPCPWCKMTPKFKMDFGAGGNLDATFLPHVYCDNHSCTVQPKAKYVPIRKGQRFSIGDLCHKIQKALSNWNEGNPFAPTEGIRISFEEILDQILKVENAKEE